MKPGSAGNLPAKAKADGRRGRAGAVSKWLTRQPAQWHAGQWHAGPNKRRLENPAAKVTRKVTKPTGVKARLTPRRKNYFFFFAFAFFFVFFAMV
jgi:hypothetical protein